MNQYGTTKLAGGESVSHGGQAGVDNTARQLARQVAADFEALKLDNDTVITLSPDFVAGSVAQRNLYLSIRHPLGAYSTGEIITASIQGTSNVIQQYNARVAHAVYTFGITAQNMQNLANANHLVEGKFLDVSVSILTRPVRGQTLFYRVMSVPVVAA